MKPSETHAHLQLLDSGDVMALLRMSRSTLWRHIKDKTVPVPIYVGKTPMWHQRTLESWMSSKGIDLAITSRRGRDLEELC